MNYLEKEEKKERRKVILVSTVIVAIILVLIAAIIVVANKKSSSKTKVAETSETAARQESVGVTVEDTANESSANEEAEATESIVIPSEATNESVASLPATGAEDLLPLALMAGAGVCYVSSRYLVRSKSRVI